MRWCFAGFLDCFLRGLVEATEKKCSTDRYVNSSTKATRGRVYEEGRRQSRIPAPANEGLRRMEAIMKMNIK
jgi:hypothetical protein